MAYQFTGVGSGGGRGGSASLAPRESSLFSLGSALPGPSWCSLAPACELLPRVLSSEVVSVLLVAGAHARLRLSLIVRHRFFCATVQPPPPAPRSSDPAREQILKTIGFWPLCGDGPTESSLRMKRDKGPDEDGSGPESCHGSDFGEGACIG